MAECFSAKQMHSPTILLFLSPIKSTTYFLSKTQLEKQNTIFLLLPNHETIIAITKQF